MNILLRLVLLLVCFFSLDVICVSLDDEDAAALLWERAVSYASRLSMDTAVQEKLQARDVATLHLVAKHQLQQPQQQQNNNNDDDRDRAMALEILHALADSADEPHNIASQVTLGFYYYETVGDKIKALG